MRDELMNDDLMKCATCSTPRASRYAAYCHVCGSPLPELPPDPNDPAAAPAHQGWEDPAAAAGAVFATGAGARDDPGFADPAGAEGVPANVPSYPAGVPPHADDASVRQPDPAPARPPTENGGVRVYERPETPPSVQRRRRLTLLLAGIGVAISLLLLFLGPLRSVFGARSEPAWSPPGTETPAAAVVATLPPGMSAAQATAQARRGTATVAPTWTPGVDIGTAPAGGETPGSGAVATGAVATGAVAPAATVVLPTLAPAATATPAPTATAPAPTATVPAPTAAPTATAAPAAEPPPTAAGSGATIPGAISGGRAIAFVSDRSGSPQVWVMDAAGANQIPVTREGQNTSPSWSPDNRYLYYLGRRGGEAGIYRLDVSTGREERVLQDASIISARPLPNGELAILRTESGRYALYVGDRRLFQLDRSFQFQFSPDGRRVVIDPNSDPRAISVVDVSSTRAQEVAPARSWNAGWGQGERLVYVSDRSGIAAVYIAGPNGEEARAVSPGDKWSQAPAFSSDGAQIAFIAGDGGAWNVYVVSAAGQNARKVGGPANPGKSPFWQPGGAQIAYESNRGGNWDIYVTDPNGSERALTNDPGNDVDPAWTW